MASIVGGWVSGLLAVRQWLHAALCVLVNKHCWLGAVFVGFWADITVVTASNHAIFTAGYGWFTPHLSLSLVKPYTPSFFYLTHTFYHNTHLLLNYMYVQTWNPVHMNFLYFWNIVKTEGPFMSVAFILWYMSLRISFLWVYAWSLTVNGKVAYVGYSSNAFVVTLLISMNSCYHLL